MLDVKKMVLPWPLLAGLDALLLLVCGNDVAISMPEEVLSAELEIELPGVISVTVGVGVEIELEVVEVTPVIRQEHAEEISDGESEHFETKSGSPVVAV